MENKQLEQLIQAAVKKINGKKENDICRFIPISTGGYIHHFTMRKMKSEDPKQLAEWINKHIINQNNPQEVTPKQRAARGSRKRQNQYTFSEEEVKRIREYAKIAGDEDMARRLRGHNDPTTTKRELIASIRHNRIEPDLWNAYVDWATSANAAQLRGRNHPELV